MITVMDACTQNLTVTHISNEQNSCIGAESARNVKRKTISVNIGGYRSVKKARQTEQY